VRAQLSAALDSIEPLLVDPWAAEATGGSAALSLDVAALGEATQLLEADTRSLWFRWALESLLDPAVAAASGMSYLHVYKVVLEALRSDVAGPAVPEVELRQLAARTARHLTLLVARIAEREKRIVLPRSFRLDLVSAQNETPRCWLCGFEWPASQVERFVEGEVQEPGRRRFVDFAKPIGSTSSSAQIEIDHVLPLGAGGGNEMDNLRLACGWCNRVKSDAINLYDAPTSRRRKTYVHPQLGVIALPDPSLVVRLLGMVRRCFSCARDAHVTELTIDWGGPVVGVNPLTARVTCYEHDRFAGHRLVEAHGR
jgi:hypothetical protein